MNASPTTLLTKALTQPVTTQQALVNMGLLSSFSINTTNADSDKPYTLSHKLTCTPSSSSSSSSSMSTTQSSIKTSRRKPAELKFKMESMGAHPEQDDDLDMCPARTRANWPRTALIPWWQPSQPQDKPPYSYATLIAYAILISQDGRLLLSDIYRWISETYPYYLLDKRGWQNSIRHNLSLNKKWFIKVDRRPTQANPGKGCYWTLVPGTEEMFIENITEAGGHNRKHHDVGLTAELSMGHRNNLLARYQQQQQQQQQQSGSSMNRHETSQSLSSSANNDKLSTVPPKSCKSSAPLPTPWMGPMYSTFRMTSTTMESVSQETTLKKQKRNSTPLATAPSKRPKLDGTLDPTNEDDDDEYMDTRSDCDSGVDVSNEPLDDKKNTNTGVSGDFTMVAHDDLDLYNVLDHFLDQLPLPETQMDSLKHNEELHLPYDHYQPAHDFDLYAAAAQQQPTQFFPTHPADLDPVLGYPSWNYYSTNGFYCDEANPMFPTLLTSCFDPTSSVTATNAMLINDDAPAYFDTQQQPTLSYSQQDKAPLVIHLNGGCVMDLEEEIADTYLKFEEDDAVMDTLTTMEGNPMVSTNVDYHPQDYAFMPSHYV